jgi:hypothetical protein
MGYGLWVMGYQLSAIGYRLSVIGYRLSAIGYRLSAIGYRQLPSNSNQRNRKKYLNHQRCPLQQARTKQLASIE